ncbi:osmoprotectant transport system substrate-binding protein [Anaerovirgula multivorans]|uniref:Osmoprotectant transport system substrate-binding protein n=1 Tax=Anaerovirgula multivorans TaxID=312168 RepID=A0A239GEL2_9FIRM|nr:glycine betaine ABC transporter substrate-binding protein [Anaerovirgula multivorans]SNS66913.1 osmoprotectant transport system substrate-binding protein [Anaerovirgula multivorans]
MYLLRNKKILLVISIMLMVSLALVGCGGGNTTDEISTGENGEPANTNGGNITIGAKNFTESILLGNIFKVLIEEKTDINVTVTELGGTMIAFEALKNNDIQMYPEYTGTGYITILGHEEILSPEETYEIVKNEFREEWNFEWLSELGFNNTYTLSLRQDSIEELGIKTFSDLVNVAGELKLGATMEFVERQDGLPGLNQAYGFEFGDVIDLDPGLMYTAVKEEQVDVITAFATDGRIPAFNLGILEDDLNFFPPYFAAPLVRGDLLEQYPELINILNELEGKINDDTMAQLNYTVDESARSEEAVAREFLESIGLI